MNIIKLEADVNELLILRNSKPVIFAGSAVSIWKPSGLINGMSVTKSFWDILFKDFTRSPDEEDFIDSLVWEFPFEHLFELCPNKQKANQFLIETYNCSVANPVHKAIVTGFNDGRIHHIITTNYDNCFEGALINFPALKFKTIVDEKEALQNYSDKISKFFFKIHGTADEDSETLVFTLRDQGFLPIGKRQLLKNLMFEKVCLFVGYSGLDFDLCPLIAKIPEIKIYWIDIKDYPQSVNAKNLLVQTNGTYIQADMREFIQRWLGIDCNADYGAKDITINDIENIFSKEEIFLWRIALLNNIGLPEIAIKAIEEAEGKIDESERLLHKARALFYQGKYLSASKTFSSTAWLHLTYNNYKRSSEVFLDASDSYRAGGYFFRACSCLFAGRFISRKYDKAKYLLKKSLLISNFLEGVKSFKAFKFLSNILKQILKSNLKSCAKLSLNQGSLHDFQQVGLIAERSGIQSNELIESDYYPPNQSKEGYKHLGYYHAQVIAFNDECLRTNFETLRDEEKTAFLDNFNKHIKYCELTGQNGSLWKLFANKKRFLDKVNLDIFDSYQKLDLYFQSCEYSRLMKRQQALKFGINIKIGTVKKIV